MISYVILNDIVYDIMYDISIMSVWYQSTYHKRSGMISGMISIMISGMISCMMARCLHQQPKMRCIGRCRSRALQVQAQDVWNRRRWSSALLDEPRLVLGVRRIRPRRRVSQSVVVWARWAPHQARRVFLVVRQRRHRWTRRRCSAGAPGAGPATWAYLASRTGSTRWAFSC